jgi:TPR repeat protein
MLALSLAGESGAILHIMRAYYLKGSKEACATYLSNFNKAEILSVRKQLEALATAQDKSKQNPDILTLWGMFLEMDGRTDEARALYEAAVEIAPTEFKPSTGISEGISFPQLAPWNALGLLLLAENTPESLESAKKAFRRGALKADDPVSYYHLANLMTKGSGTWLHYMTKAAGSGHRDAMHALGIFYGKGTAQELVDKSDDSYFRRLMRWFLNMPPKSMTLIAAEWLTEGCKAGHKPSMLALVDYIDNSPRGKKETREESIDEVKRHWLEQIMKAPRGGERERWPDVVKDATKRLSEMGNKGIKKAAK